MTEITRADIQRDLQEIFRNLFDDHNLVLTDATQASNIAGWDSLQQIKIILACEKKLKVRLRARDINALENFGEMVDHLYAAVNKTARK
jgi:acyl carrier protein